MHLLKSANGASAVEMAVNFAFCALIISSASAMSTGEAIMLNEITSNDIDQCKDVCTDSYFLLPKHADAQSICQRGCRFFNIIYLKDDHSFNMTKEECYMSCDEAYDEDDLQAACNIGCKSMLKKKQSEMDAVIVYIEQDKNFFLMEPDLELLESELLSENMMQNQMKFNEFGLDVEYKIPKTKIRTMPIDTFTVVDCQEVKPTGDWLDCASRNSGIPKWVLLLAIVGAILVALWLSITSEKKVMSDEMLLATDDDHLRLPDKGALLDEKGEISFAFVTPSTPPPAYSLESEKV